MTKYNSKLDSKKIIPAPKLPKEAQLPVHLGLDGCVWLDEYVEFSQIWSPRSYDGYHEAIGLWVLSTVAARRVTILFGGGAYTNLYMLLVGRTSLYAKSTAVQIGKDLLDKVGLSYLLLPDESTPQSMIREMSGQLPKDFGNLPKDVQAKILKEVTFSGQRGWYYDEFGGQLQNMMKKDGPSSEFRTILRKLYDTENFYVKATIQRGKEEILQPYLSLLGVLTPADIAPVAKVGSMLWGDGYLARMGLIFPPAGIIKDGEFPIGERILDESLLNPIIAWHKRLGLPSIEYSNGKVKRDFTKANSKLNLSEEARKAYYCYDTALRNILIDMPLTDLDGNYARFPEKALRIAALFTSLEGSNEIGLNHWAKAQAISERWRSNLHSLYKQVNSESTTTQKWTDEQKVLKAIYDKVNPTSREIQQFTGLSSEAATKILEVLITDNKVTSEVVGKTTRYTRCNKQQ